ncbi:MAG: M20/M25/M40 family metallo-hydrolase [Chloroflexota bacterium]|jgi:succinyl-diaminopimelate desuccinylase
MDIDWGQTLAGCVDFTQRLIQTPSMPGDELAIGYLVADELRRLGYDEVWHDAIGNVFGRVYGRDRNLPTLVLNTHLDHVDPGDLSLWPVPPYRGVIRDGRILGRGACDIKGPLAVQVYSPAALLAAEERPHRDIVFCGVVQEEVGGAGARYWVERLDYPVEVVVIGEPSANQLALGHRGIVQVWLTFHGRSVHASAPERGENPNYALAAFLSRLEKAQSELKHHPYLGPTSIAPTIVQVDTTSGNVTPGWTRVLLDIRTATESIVSLYDLITDLVGNHSFDMDYGDSLDKVIADSAEIITGFYTSPDNPIVRQMAALIGDGMGRVPGTTRYRFATDGRHFAPHGLLVVGFGPGEEELAHTVHESIAIDQIDESLRGHIRLLREF